MSRTFRAIEEDITSGKWYQRNLHGRQRAYLRACLYREDYDAIYDWPIYDNWEVKEQRGVGSRYDRSYCYCHDMRRRGQARLCYTCERLERLWMLYRRERRIITRQRDRVWSASFN